MNPKALRASALAFLKVFGTMAAASAETITVQTGTGSVYTSGKLTSDEVTADYTSGKIVSTTYSTLNSQSGSCTNSCTGNSWNKTVQTTYFNTSDVTTQKFQGVQTAFGETCTISLEVTP